MGVKVETPPCMLCGKTSTVKLTEDEYVALMEPRRLIQDALPERDAEFREMVKSGIHPACWHAMFDEMEDEDDE